MPSLKIMGFDGLVPRQSSTMLGDTQAQTADNVKLYSRELRYWRGPAADEYNGHNTATPPLTNVATIYKYYSNAAALWLTWGSVVDVVQSPSADLTDYRLYYTGDGEPKKTNYSLVSTGSGVYPRASRPMGVPAPTVAPTVARSGTGTLDPESRAYVYTHVTTFGTLREESAPSPASAVVTIYTGDSCNVSAFTTPPTGYGIDAIRVYRTVTGATTDSYQFVTEIALASIGSTYNDTKTAAQLGEVLPTLGWLPPPAGLKGLQALPGGTLVGFTGNTICFSEPYYPHAWPVRYVLTTPSTIVGLGVYGSMVVVLTDRYPYVISGGVPGFMSMERVPILEPCVSARSIVSDEFGVVYASPNGLVGIGAGMRGVITTGLYRRDEWQDVNPDDLISVIYDGRYIGTYNTTDESQRALVISRQDIPALSHASLQARAVHVDSRDAKLYYVSPLNNKIYEADADELNPLTYEWKSKRFVLPQGTTFSALKLDANFDQQDNAADYAAAVAAVSASNAVIFAGGALDGVLNTTALNTYDVNGSAMTNLPTQASLRTAQVLLYGDGELAATLSITSFDPVRIPSFRCRTLEVAIAGTMDVRSVQLATTVMELHQ